MKIYKRTDDILDMIAYWNRVLFTAVLDVNVKDESKIFYIFKCYFFYKIVVQ